MSDNQFRYDVYVTVVNTEKYEGDWPPKSLAGFTAWLESKIAQIPEEYRESATVEIGSTSGYEGSHYATLEISYCRPPTDEGRYYT